MTTAVQTRLVPLGDFVLARPLPQEERTASGLVVPDTAKDKPNEAEVIAIGPGRVTDSGERIPMELQPGDRVFIQAYTGNEIKLDGDDYLLIRETAVLARRS